jgi:beta-glucanase (GH16 family)
VAVAWVAAALHANADAPSTPSGWNRVFLDDFTGAKGTGVDQKNWLYDKGHGYAGGAGNWGTGEIEEVTDSTANVFHDGSGNLAIKPIRDTSGNWTSGRIETQRTDLAAPVGGVLRVEGRLQQPNVDGAAAAGYWPAFWMLGAAARPAAATNWPGIGEIDLMENVNGRSALFGTLHCGVFGGGPCNETTGLGSGEKQCAGCQTGFHTYAMEYDRSSSVEELRWYLDGVQFHSIKSTKVDAKTWNDALHHGYFIILNVAIGGVFPAVFGGGPTDATKPGVPMLVDYVAAYTRGGGGSVPPPPAPTQSPQPPSASPSESPTGSPSASSSAEPTPSSSASKPGGAVSAYSTIEAEDFGEQSGTGIAPAAARDSNARGQHVGPIGNGDWLRYDNVDFGSAAATQFVAKVASDAGGGVSGLVEVHLDSANGSQVTSLAIGNTGGAESWRTIPANTQGVTGKHTIYVTFVSGQPADFVMMDSFHFAN